MSGDQPQRRAQQRFDISIPVTLEYQGKELSAETKNLSLGGMFVHTEEDVPFGAEVKVKFRIPTLRDSIEVDAHVRWKSDGGLGIQFGALRPQPVWALQKFFEASKGKESAE